MGGREGKVPNHDRAVIDERKVRDYLLSPVHPIGRHKARFFYRLGYIGGRRGNGWPETSKGS